MSQKDTLLIHIDALYRSALYLVKNEINADDLVQETYLKAFKSLQNGEIISNERAWLFKILMNTFINQYRKSKTEPSLVDFDSIESFHESIKEEVLMSPIAENEAEFDELPDSDVKKYFYAFLDSELDVEKNIEVLAHVNMCHACGLKIEKERLLQERVKETVLKVKVPAYLEQKILRSAESRPKFFPQFKKNLLLRSRFALLSGIATAIILILTAKMYPWFFTCLMIPQLRWL